MREVKCSAKSPVQLDTIIDLPSRYKAVLLDQFGVLHDGVDPYPGAIQAVQAFAQKGLRVLIISNSSRRSSGALGKLAAMGFPEEAFAGAITSGEVAHTALLRRQGQFWETLGNRCIHFTWGARGSISLEGLGLEVVRDVEEAEFVLAHGTEALGAGDGMDPTPISLEEIKEILSVAAAKNLPLLIANPDIVTVDKSYLRLMPGMFGRWYSEMGGKECVLLGKPAPVIYQAAMQLLGLDDAKDIIAIGDSLEHDIAGAQSSACDSVFVAGGIHAEELGVSGTSKIVDIEKLEALCEQHGAQPNFVIPFLQ
ncbi:probable acid sugar phosphatase [Coccomyxa sp. Obi]|nr:probable acid sugar phosphatase [Coccomyxa sp. Obi]